jgi:PAS domain S-box-containing protein
MCRIIGLTEAEADTADTGQFERIHAEDRERVRGGIQLAFREGASWAGDYRLVRSDGVRFLHARGEVVRDEAGKVVRMFGTAQDVTEQKQLEARVILSDRLASLGTMAAGVGHEINNPLASVMSNLDLIAEEIRMISGSSPSGRIRDIGEMVNEARLGAERVRKIVRGLRTFSRIEKEHRVTLDVKEVLELSINMAFSEIRYRARLVKDYGTTPPVEADEARLGQVFINLLVNAAQAIPEGNADQNEIRLITRTDAAGMAVVEVRDTGNGISPEALPHIFDPFFTTRAIGEGTGLGLSICHGIVGSLGGSISVESEAGKGARFRVTLPAARLPQPANEPPPEPMKQGSPRRGRVLVVDDDKAVGNVLLKVLGAEHDVTVLSNAGDALARLVSGEHFDVILCDLMMPEMTGMDLHAELRRQATEHADRMIFLTGGAFSPTAHSFLDEVPNQRFEKPFNIHNLRAAVRGFVDRRSG